MPLLSKMLLRLLVVPVVAVLVTFPHATFSQHVAVASIDYEIDGSEPPPALWFSCIQEFGERWRTEEQALICLKRILETGLFKHGSVKRTVRSDGKVELIFSLISPALELTKLSLGSRRQDRKSLALWLNRTGSSMRIGQMYSWDSQRTMAIRMEEWFRMQGRKVAIVVTERLDYRKLRATIEYKIHEGPKIAPEPPPVRSTSECDQLVVSLDWMGFDDFVPHDLVKRLTKTRGATCFDADGIYQDVQRLRGTGLFEDVRYKVEGLGGQFKVSLEIQGKPIKLRSVEIKGHGLLRNRTFDRISDLPTRPGEIFRQSTAAASTRILQEWFSQPGRRLEVLEEVEQLSPTEVRVRFHLLACEMDKALAPRRLKAESRAGIAVSRPGESRPEE